MPKATHRATKMETPPGSTLAGYVYRDHVVARDDRKQWWVYRSEADATKGDYLAYDGAYDRPVQCGTRKNAMLLVDQMIDDPSPWAIVPASTVTVSL